MVPAGRPEVRMHVKTVQRRDLVIQEIRALSSILFYVAYDLCFDRGILGIGTSKDHLRSIANCGQYS